MKKKIQAYVLGCPCHKAATALADTTGFDIENLALDVSYWFDKSTRRKAGLKEFCVFCDTTVNIQRNCFSCFHTVVES